MLLPIGFAVFGVALVVLYLFWRIGGEHQEMLKWRSAYDSEAWANKRYIEADESYKRTARAWEERHHRLVQKIRSVGAEG